MLLKGVVQGVGFRPHVANVAQRFPITGFCGNDAQEVFIEVQGQERVLDEFADALLGSLPPLARVVETSMEEIPVVVEHEFRIVASMHKPGERTLLPPDVATCDACLSDMADPANPRHQYAFTNCTDCGPRLSIIRDLPYDRPVTTMAHFPMCESCSREYADIRDRRFHAQPISCPNCGPRLWIETPQNLELELGESAPSWASRTPEYQQSVINDALRRLTDGEVLAIKGIGGFHLVCDARNASAVQRLRERKRRSTKPFAVMAANLDAAHRVAHIAPLDAALLRSPARPILILPARESGGLDEGVAPGAMDVGLMLPYAPLHHLLFRDPSLVLVMTSGNLSDEPLCYRNDDARERLTSLADAFLMHDRPIEVPVEDSVVLANKATGVPVRRSRGYAPVPVPVDAEGPVTLAVGGELKNTATLLSGGWAHITAHIGDMGSLAGQQALDHAVEQLLAMRQVTPEVVACDLHPGYATTGWAERWADAHGVEHVVQVQHHLAHAVSLLTEHRAQQALVAVLDGTGYGVDGTIWGGELLDVDLGAGTWRRAAHVPTFPLVGGDRAIKYPWRIALGLAHEWGLDVSSNPAFLEAPEAERKLVQSQLASGFGVVQTSSTGRLFDAASALLGVCQQVGHEAQAAVLLEQRARVWKPTSADTHLDPVSLQRIFELLLCEELPVEQRAWRFHRRLATWFADSLRAHGDGVVGLTGGVMANRVFSTMLVDSLSGFEVLAHKTVPANDGGLSLGQAVTARLAVAGTFDLTPAEGLQDAQLQAEEARSAVSKPR